MSGSGFDSDGGIETADDEAIMNYTRVRSTGTRAIAVDKFNNAWVGGYLDDRWHQKLDGVTGAVITGTEFSVGNGGYAAVMDGIGQLWSAASEYGLLRYVPSTGMDYHITCPNGGYGLGIEPRSPQYIWYTKMYANDRVTKLSLDGTWQADYNYWGSTSQGIVIDYQNNVWIARSWVGGTNVAHLKTDGAFVGNVSLNGKVGDGPTGVSVDHQGKIWVSNRNSHNAMRIDPNGGFMGDDRRIGAVDLTVKLGGDADPYNYSDMTGFVLLGATFPSGSWIFVHDGGFANLNWNRIQWNPTTQPLETGVKVEARAANQVTDLTSAPFQTVSNNLQFGPFTGRYLEIRVTLWRSLGTVNRPILTDLTVHVPN